MWSVSRGDQALLCVLSVAVALLTAVPLEIQRRVINGVLAGGTLRDLAMLCGLYVMVAIAQGLLKLAMNYCRGRAGENASRDLRERIYAGALDGSDQGDDGAGRLVNMVSVEVEPVGGFVGESVSVPLVQAGTLASVFGYMFWTEPLMAVAGLVLLGPQAWFIVVIQRRINERNRERTESLRDLGDHLVHEAGEPEAEPDRAVFARLVSRIRRLRLVTFRLKFTMKFLVNLLQHLGTVLVLFLGGWLVLEGRTEVGTVVAFVSGMERVADPWRDLVAFFRQLSDARMRFALVRDTLIGRI